MTPREWGGAIRQLLVEHRPALAAKMPSLSAVPREWSMFFDTNFPRRVGWGSESIAHIPKLLRQYLEAAK